MEYDFKALSDYDFELLVCDLLSARQGRRVESFRQGRDQGVDLRYTTTDGGSAVVQCRHYAKTPFSGLCAAMKKEYAKIQKLHPERYLLVTSQPLTPAEKDRLMGILTPFCKSTEDILGGNELNSLLRQYPQVERAHYKLWLTSSAVLEKLLHSEIYRQSAMMREEIQNKLQLYVQSKTAYDKAREMLKKFNCCIISGIPGIGKTTLAEILSVYYLDRGYQIIKVRSDIQEALKAYHPDQRQAFIYDDFLGSTGLELKENKNEGKELLTFLDVISGKKGKKFILTTREYILNQACQSSEDFARTNFDYKKCIISLEDYTRSDRARILYNHLFFCEVSREDIQDLLADNRVMKIIDHRNYSPRLIETVIKLWASAEDERSSGFYRFFSGTLDHPNQLWEHAFCRKISPAARDLLLLLCPDPRSVSLRDLKCRYEGYHQHKSRVQNQPMRMTDFRDALKEAEGTFIRIDGSEVSYHNPSVRDFIHGYIRENDAEFKILCETAIDFDFCVHLASLDRSLCRTYPEELIAAFRGTAGKGGPDTLADQITKLTEVNRQLQTREIEHLTLHLLELFLDQLERERGKLEELDDGEEPWQNIWSRMIEPGALKELLEDLDLSKCELNLTDRLFTVFFQYALAWFNWAFNYSPADFLIFPVLRGIRPFSVGKREFQKVYEALADYSDNIAPSDIQYMDYEEECRSFQWNIDYLADFFHTDLSDILSDIDDRIYELEQEEEDDDEYQSVDSPAANKLENGEILNMFQSLLEQ